MPSPKAVRGYAGVPVVPDGGVRDRRLGVPLGGHPDPRDLEHLPEGSDEFTRARRAHPGLAFYAGLDHWYLLVTGLAGPARH